MTKHINRWLVQATVVGCLLVGAMDSPAADDTWEMEITPYFWAAGIDIDTTTVKGRRASGEFDFGDLFQNLNFGGAVHFEAWKGKWGLLVEDFYIDLETDASFVPRIGPNVNATVGIRQNLFELAVAYHIDVPGVESYADSSERPIASKLAIQPIAGIRYGTLEQDIKLKLTPAQLPLFGETTRTFAGDDWWIEIFGGARLTYEFSARTHLMLRADLGGIKAGDETVFTWHMFPELRYKPWQSFALNIGYKVYAFNYENQSSEGDFVLDATMHGPTLGLTYYF